MIRTIVTFIMTVCILMGCFTVSVSAATYNDARENTMAAYYSTASVKLTISNGTANLSGNIEGYPGTTTKTSVHLYLQKYSNGKWSNVGDWLSIKYSSSCTVSKTKVLSKGKYRVKAVCKAYAGEKNETITKYSSTKTY